MTTALDHRVMINYVGEYWTNDGKKHETQGTVLEYIEEEREDLSAGLRGDYVIAAPVHKLDGEENIVSVGMHEWFTTACVQNGGHNLVVHQLSEEPDDAIQICTRCGQEVG